MNARLARICATTLFGLAVLVLAPARLLPAAPGGAPAAGPGLPVVDVRCLVEATPSPTAESRPGVPDLLVDSRAALKEGDYDRAARNLKEAIGRSQQDPELLAEAYLLIVSTYVQRGNFYKNEPQGRETSDLYYREAGRYVGECLNHPELHHVRPEPATRYPPEMVDLFRRAREEMFGSLRLTVTPRDALVLLDGDTLSLAPGDSTLEAADVPSGLHPIRISHQGYRELRETVRISTGSTTERDYALTRRRGVLWYAGRVSLGIGGAAVYFASRTHPKKEPGPPPLGAPPGWPH